MSFIEKRTSPGMRLPPERMLARTFGVARRTLRYTLAEWEANGLLRRTSRGTFLRDRKEENSIRSEAVSVLVACPDYVTESGFYSAYLAQQMIQGAMLSARDYGMYAVTLPITEDNRPEHINWQQFRHLGKDDVVLFSGVWSRDLYLELAQRKCRLGYICDREDNLPELDRYGIDFFNFYLGDYWRCLGDAVRILHADGAQRIQYFGRETTDISKYGRPCFEAALAGENLECDHGSYRTYSGRMRTEEILEELKACYRTRRFDGLIFDLLTREENEFDFFERTGLPGNLHYIFNVSEFLKRPELPPHSRVLYRPQKESSRRICDFLLSGEHGCIRRRMEYSFPRLPEFRKL